MIQYLTLEQILKTHSILIEKFGGLRGIRDINLLASTVEMPKAIISGRELYPTIFDKASVYLFNIARNHPFNDGNKRTGFAITYLFFDANKAPILFQARRFENFVIEVAKGNKTKQQIVDFFENGKEL